MVPEPGDHEVPPIDKADRTAASHFFFHRNISRWSIFSYHRPGTPLDWVFSRRHLPGTLFSMLPHREFGSQPINKPCYSINDYKWLSVLVHSYTSFFRISKFNGSLINFWDLFLADFLVPWRTKRSWRRRYRSRITLTTSELHTYIVTSDKSDDGFQPKPVTGFYL